MKREFSAGGTVFKVPLRGDQGSKSKATSNSELLWLIIKPRPSKLFPNERYQLPKGHLEEGESSAQAAIREVFEETGVVAKIIAKVGYSRFPLKIGEEKIFKVITYFLMEYESGELMSSSEVEELYWLGFDEAKKKLTFSDDKKILQKAFDMAAQQSFV